LIIEQESQIFASDYLEWQESREENFLLERKEQFDQLESDYK
jgi:hypothetical protein